MMTTMSWNKTLRTHRQFELKANGDVDQHQQMLKPQHPQSEYKAHSRLVHQQHQLCVPSQIIWN
jgi:hypothetical protein